jgi:type IV secretory pathway VirB6-like protein
MGMFSQVTQQTLALISTYEPVFLSTGVTLFRIFATILLIIEGIQVGRGEGAQRRLIHLVFIVALIHVALTYYNAPLPWGRNVPQTISDAGIGMAEQIDDTIDQRLGAAISQVIGNVSGSAWDIVVNTGEAIRYFLITFALVAMQGVVLGVIAFGFVASGVFILIGPVLIPFALVPGLEYLAIGWLRVMIQYALYPVVGQAFVFVYANVFLGFSSQFSGAMDAQRIAGLFIEILILTIACIFGIIKIPQLVADLCAGSTSIAALPVRWWKV